MSCHVDHIVVTLCENLRVEEEVFQTLKEEFEEDLPENSFFEGPPPAQDGFIHFKGSHHLEWYGVGSCRSLNILTGKILPKFHGSLDIIFILDVGDFLGYRLRGHEVTKHRVVFSLGELQS